MNNTPEIKEITDATFELGRKTVQTVSELNTRVLTDVVDYAETVARANSTWFTAPMSSNALTETWGRMQSEMIKGYSTWTDYFKNFSKQFETNL